MRTLRAIVKAAFVTPAETGHDDYTNTRPPGLTRKVKLDTHSGTAEIWEAPAPLTPKAKEQYTRNTTMSTIRATVLTAAKPIDPAWVINLEGEESDINRLLGKMITKGIVDGWLVDDVFVIPLPDYGRPPTARDAMLTAKAWFDDNEGSFYYNSWAELEAAVRKGSLVALSQVT